MGSERKNVAATQIDFSSSLGQVVRPRRRVFGLCVEEDCSDQDPELLMGKGEPFFRMAMIRDDVTLFGVEVPVDTPLQFAHFRFGSQKNAVHVDPRWPVQEVRIETVAEVVCSSDLDKSPSVLDFFVLGESGS